MQAGRLEAIEPLPTPAELRAKVAEVLFLRIRGMGVSYSAAQKQWLGAAFSMAIQNEALGGGRSSREGGGCRVEDIGMAMDVFAFGRFIQVTWRRCGGGRTVIGL